MSEPQPFDPGYDYEADKDIVERLSDWTARYQHYNPIMSEIIEEAAGTIRALRLLNKNMELTINGLIAERDANNEPETFA